MRLQSCKPLNPRVGLCGKIYLSDPVRLNHSNGPDYYLRPELRCCLVLASLRAAELWLT